MELKKENVISKHGLYLVSLLLVAVAVNYQIKILGFYQDDLYLWTRYADHHALGYIFQTGTSRFRPVWEFLAYIELKLTGVHTWMIVPTNIVVNAGIAGLVYGIGLRLSGKKPIAFLAGIAFLLSRFSYYQISMVLGLMESAAMIQALGILYCLYQFLNQERRWSRYGVAASMLYFTLVFTHERYMVLFPLLLVVFLMKKQYKLAGITMIEFIVIQLIRWWAIGTMLPPGAGHTTVAETFHISQAFYYAISQVLYLFGISMGPDYLSGIPWGQTSFMIRCLVVLSILVLMAVCLLFFIALVKDRDNRKRHLINTALFFSFIALCIGSSSVTIRVEMRWVYISYAAALCFLCYIYRSVTKGKTACGLLILCYVLLLFPIEGYYRKARENMYYWSNQRRANTLQEITYGKYGNELFNKQIYLLENTFNQDEWTLTNFFRVFRKDKMPGVPAVKVVDSVDDFGLVDDTMLILAEDKKDNTYLDVTEFVKEEKLKLIEGCYEDGWLDQYSKFVVKAGSSGKIRFRFYYPGQLSGKEEAIVKRDGSELFRINFDSQSIVYELEAEPYEKLHLTISCNFVMDPPPEIRGEYGLSMVLQMEAP